MNTALFVMWTEGLTPRAERVAVTLGSFFTSTRVSASTRAVFCPECRMHYTIANGPGYRGHRFFTCAACGGDGTPSPEPARQ